MSGLPFGRPQLYSNFLRLISPEMLRPWVLVPAMNNNNTPTSTQDSIDSPFETLYTPRELSLLFKFDERTIRRWFIDEPGVLKFGKEDRRDGKRQYVTLRIPAFVANRAYKQKLQ